MDLGIRGKKAIIAGGSAGMGKGSALALAEEGVEVFLSARGENRLLAACEEISDWSGTRVTPVVSDHSTGKGREALIKACPDPDILIITISPSPSRIAGNAILSIRPLLDAIFLCDCSGSCEKCTPCIQ